MAMVLGVGSGLFTVICFAAAALVAALLGIAVRPNQAFPISVACAAVPAIVFGLIAASPTEADSAGKAIDKMYPVRVTLLLALSLCLAIGAVASTVLPILNQPKFSAPRAVCKRRHLESRHPSWIK